MSISKEEARVMVLCTLMLAIGVCISLVVLRCHDDKDELPETDNETLTTLQHKWNAHTSHGRRGNEIELTPFPFDPNHADSATLCRLGLKPWQVSNMLKYRRKGGRWRSADDLQRLYGLSKSQFEQLRPYVHIAEADKRKVYERAEWQSNYEHEPRPKTEKLAEGVTLPANTADTTALKHIPGIGSYYARKIVDYRERLGGFVSTSQIGEIEDLPAGITRWFVLDKADKPRQLRINHATFKQLVRHPYLSYEQTKIIVTHIRQYGAIRSWRDLQLYKEFTQNDFKRLAPYISFK